MLLILFKPLTYLWDIFFRGNFDKLKGDIRLMKEELVGIERYRATKERLLIQAASNLEAMQTTRSGLESELHQVLILFLDII